MSDNLSSEQMLAKHQRDKGKRTKPVAEPNAAVDDAEPVGIDYHAEEIRKIAGLVGAAIIEIGRRLTECKKLVPHGGWADWLEREFDWSDSTAQNYMRAFERFGSNSQRVGNLRARVIYLLAAPGTPADFVEEILTQKEKTGNIPSFEAIKGGIEAAKRAAEQVEAKITVLIAIDAGSSEPFTEIQVRGPRSELEALRDANPGTKHNFLLSLAWTVLPDAPAEK